jgi:hypothetical protein
MMYGLCEILSFQSDENLGCGFLDDMMVISIL